MSHMDIGVIQLTKELYQLSIRLPLGCSKKFPNTAVNKSMVLSFFSSFRSPINEPQSYLPLKHSISTVFQHFLISVLLFFFSADEGFDGTYPTNVVVRNNGSCLYVPPGIFKSTCKIDITWFPFDDQRCEMKFGSWTYDGFQVGWNGGWNKQCALKEGRIRVISLKAVFKKLENKMHKKYKKIK